MAKSIGLYDVTENHPTGAAKLNWNTLDILAPQLIMLLTAAVITLVKKIASGRPRSGAIMIGFTGMVIATLVQLRNYPSFFAGGSAALHGLSGQLVFDPMGWILTFSILLLATAAILLRRLRNYSGHGDGRFCLLIILSTVGWSLMPIAASFPVLAGCMLLGSLPLWMLSTFGSRDGVRIPLTNKTLLVVLAVMLLALVPMTIRGVDFSGTRMVIPGWRAAAYPWAGILTVLFFLPMLFWAGSMPLHWWFGEAAAETPAEVGFFLLLVPYVGSMAALLRMLFALDRNNSRVAGVVALAVAIVALMAAALYSLRALTQNNIRAVVGNLLGTLAAMILFTLGVAVSPQPLSVAHLVGCILLYALTASLAVGLALRIIDSGKPRLLGELSEWSKDKLLSALVLVLALLSLGGFPPTMGAIVRIALLRAVEPVGEWPGVVFIMVNVLSMIVGGVAALRVAAYVFLDTPESPVAIPPPSRRRKVRHRALGTLTLLLAASVINGTALLAYRPIQHLTMAFMPTSASTTATVPNTPEPHGWKPIRKVQRGRETLPPPAPGICLWFPK
ncbi:MAG: proton-conducting transporter membrane subunit [Phycisphaerae bacterium]